MAMKEAISSCAIKTVLSSYISSSTAQNIGLTTAGRRKGGIITVYIYESHLGGLYVKKYLIPNDILYCDECGDSDQLLLDTDNLDEVRDFLLSQVALFDLMKFMISVLIFQEKMRRQSNA